MIGIREDVLPTVVYVTGIPIIAFLYLWIQALVFTNNIRHALKHVGELARNSLGLLCLSIAAGAAVTLAFYIGGGLWSGSFERQVFLTTAELLRYVSVYKWGNLLVFIGVLSVAQIHYFKK